MANLEKFKLLIFGQTDVDFSFEVDGKRIKRSIDTVCVMSPWDFANLNKPVSQSCAERTSRCFGGPHVP